MVQWIFLCLLWLGNIQLFETFQIHSPTILSGRITQLSGSIRGDRWNEFLQPQRHGRDIGPSTLLQHQLTSDFSNKMSTSNNNHATPNHSNNSPDRVEPWSTSHSPQEPLRNDPQEEKRLFERRMNIAKAYETLRHQLPFFFYQQNLDFSIFGDYILVGDNNQNRITMSKTVYAAVIKSIQMAASLSKIYPSLHLQSIHYIEELNCIQCRVKIVLPDSIHIEGQSIWEGMFYFGFDDRGLINSHIFDRNLPVFRPDVIPMKASSYPWLRVDSLWNHRPESPIPGTIFSLSLADRLSSLLRFEDPTSPPSLPESSAGSPE